MRSADKRSCRPEIGTHRAPYSGTVTTTPIRTFCAGQRAGPRGVRAPGADQTTEVVGEAPAADERLERVADLTPTVVVMNVHTPGLDVAGAS
jgi:hypothetical protein